MRCRRCTAGTLSAHTVCQIPDWAVYQMPPRRSRCLPRAWWPVSLSSWTATTRTLASSPSASVMSQVNGRYPPVWSPTATPFR